MKPIIIGGSQRSGTSMLQKLVCSAPDANNKIREASYLRTLLAAYKFGRDDFSNDTVDYFGDLDFFKKFNRTLIESVLMNVRELQTEKQGVSIEKVVVKEPHLTMYFPELYELLPETQFLLIVRDPRDIVASMVDVGRRLKESGKEHFFQARDMNQLGNYIKSFYVPCLNFRDEGFQQRLMIVKYEELVANPEEFIQRAKQELGLDLKNEIADERLSSGEKYTPWQTSQLSENVNDGSVGRFRECLSRKEIADLEVVCSDYMKLFHYS